MSGTLLLALAAVAGAQTAAEALQADHAAWKQAGEAFRVRADSIPASEAADYADYLAELRRRVARGCADVTASGGSIPAGIECPAEASLPVAIPAGTETARTRDEERAALEAELGAALGEFDELLLREQDRVRAARPPADVTAASGGGDGRGEADGSGGGATGDASSGEQTASTGGQGGAQGDRSGQQGDGEGDGMSATAGGATGRVTGDGGDRQGDGDRSGLGPAGGQGASASGPDDLPDPSGDDVVARQLREAAEAERDPELKARLWDEYRRYRKGIR
jgi:hypothetical protein